MQNQPILNLSNSVFQEQVLELTNCLKLEEEQILRIHKTFVREMKNGLSNDAAVRRTSSLLMLNTFVPSFGSIKADQLDGDYLSLDLGSTNFRVLYNRLDSVEGDSFQVHYYDIPQDLRQNNSVVNLFDFMAGCIMSFVRNECPELAAKYDKIDRDNNQQDRIKLPLGFTFSFPMQQHAINIGLLETWTKNFDLPDAIGRDARQLLQESLDRVGNQYNIQIVAIINDSTGTLVKGGYIDSNCSAAMILGTGSNACYVENIANISKWPQPEQCFKALENILVNTECGGFGDNGCLDFIRTDFDRKLDSQTLFPGSFTFEKYFSGHFLGEICRIVLETLFDKGLLSQNDGFAEMIRKPGSITTKDTSIIDNSATESEKSQLIGKLLIELDNSSPTGDDMAIVKYIIDIVTKRAAQLIATILATFVLHGQPNTNEFVIAIDGSLYQNHAHLQVLIHDSIQQFVRLIDSANGRTDNERPFRLIIAEDGSGKGAGIAAALSTKLGLENKS